MSRFEHERLQQLQTHLNQQVIGQEGLVLRLLIALLADGHLLVEGAPGLAKTTAIKTLFEDMFGNRPGVFGGGFQSTRLVRARSPEINLDVKEIPIDMSRGAWLPARKLTLTETWSTDLSEVQVGQALTRTITIHAKGLTGEQLPELPNSDDKHVKVYPDLPTITTTFDGAWAVGTREQKLALVPTQPGSITIPEIRIPWWNLDTRRPEEAVLPARVLTIQGRNISTPSTELPRNNLVGKRNPQSLLPAAEAQSSLKHRLGGANSLTRLPWPIIAGILFVVWLLTIPGWVYDRKKFRTDHGTLNGDKRQMSPSLRSVRESVKQASLRNSPIQTREALFKWASVTWEGRTHSSQGSVAKKFKTLDHEPSEAQQAIWDLDRNLYPAQSEEWNGKRFWEIIAPEMKHLEQRMETASEGKEPGLAPLYLRSSS